MNTSNYISLWANLANSKSFSLPAPSEALEGSRLIENERDKDDEDEKRKREIRIADREQLVSFS